jgi:FKBP-type peptidyl-prolyl cis-trans isomerase FkpA/FKBP-type peptidyl-prolyl cis-trans isomerase FklB
MRIAVTAGLILLLLAAGAVTAAGPELKTDEQKTLYALGIALSQNLTMFNLTDAELEVVKSGLADGAQRKTAKVDMQTYGPRIKEMMVARVAMASAAEKKIGQAFADKAAAEKGATKTPSGVVMTTIKPGTGPSPAATDKVKVHYHGMLVDGTVFDSSVQRGQPIDLPLNGVIKCWSEGLTHMKVGGKSRLVCPAELAYGDRGAPPKIRPGATLVFEVELLEIVKADAPKAPEPPKAPTK